MKIGVLTLPLHQNYGGILQAYALHKVLQRMGHEPWHILRRKKTNVYSYIRKLKCIVKNVIFYKRDISTPYIQNFIDNQIQPKTKAFYSIRSLRKKIFSYEFDAIIVGSDQVWRPKYAEDCLYDYFLQFTKRIVNPKLKKFTYAASFGTAAWEFTQKQSVICKDLVQQFDAISVREDSAVTLCIEKLNVRAVHVLDPTLLLYKEDYISLIKNSTNPVIENKDLFVYFLNPTEDKENAVNKLKTKTGYVDFIIELENKESIETWLNAFYKSKFVITDSYHACVFSILFNKPFISYGNIDRGITRFTSLLKTFELVDRLIYSSSELSVENIEDIDWRKINTILDKERNKSICFLAESMS